jgi:hypothetical protein
MCKDTPVPACPVPHTSPCGLRAGKGEDGQLGNGGNANSNVPMAVAGGRTFAAISAGAFHTCGVDSGGSAWCWGEWLACANTHGACLCPVPHTSGCGLRAGWGKDGQLGIGGTADSNVPVAVAGGRTFAAISAGSAHTCGVDSMGGAWCWGEWLACANTPPVPASASLHTSACGLTAGWAKYGQLGKIEGTADSYVPVEVAGGRTCAASRPGELHTCGVDSGGSAWCWGEWAVMCKHTDACLCRASHECLWAACRSWVLWPAGRWGHQQF